MMTTANIEMLLGPAKMVLQREYGQKVDRTSVLRVIAVGESVRVRQLHQRLEIGENFLFECLRTLVDSGHLKMVEKRQGNSKFYVYTRVK